MAAAGTPPAAEPTVELARKLGTFDATLIVMGGIVGSGIFVTPSVVASRVHDTPLILAAWLLGGAITAIGAYIFAELASRRPASGGLYGYLREAYGPLVAFSYGWTALLVAQSGGIAAAAIAFGAYVAPLSPVELPARTWGIGAIAVFTAINALGVRPGSNAANGLMLLKIAALAALVAVGFAIEPHAAHATFAHVPALAAPRRDLAAFGTAMIPVFFAYSGFQMAAFMDREVKDAKRVLPPALVRGVAMVVVLYLAVNVVALRVLGTEGLAATRAPVSDIVRLAFGVVAQRIVAFAVAISLLGFISNQLLASPRIYYAMAKDRVVFRQLAWLHPRTRVPVMAIALQGVVAIAIALSGRYDQILQYVTSISLLFLSLAAGAVFVFRARDRAPSGRIVRVPGHPLTTVLFIAVGLAVVMDAGIAFPADTLAGLALLVVAVPAYYLLRR